jgi:hypothetical protein
MASRKPERGAQMTEYSITGDHAVKKSALDKADKVPLVVDVVDLMAEVARVLATKGFAPRSPISGEKGCSLTVYSQAFKTEGRIGFTQKPAETGPVQWSTVITSDQCEFIAENGTLATWLEAKQVLDGFVSVLTTVASLR